ncbi:hypothetical protein M2138_000744 [Dysgonomonadaceae bacterium PH5-43]|nr:hypothetical protein [Dysgonomonadaceae bacterium PH5-43]
MKTFRLIGKMLLVVLLVGFTAACSEDNDDTSAKGSQSGKLIKRISNDDGYAWDFSYSGKLLKSIAYSSDGDSDGGVTYSYSGNKVTMKYYGDDWNESSAMSLNKQGFFAGSANNSEYESLSCGYDANGFLVSISMRAFDEEDDYEVSSDIEMTYSGGNRTSVVVTSSDSGETKYRITYSEYENKSKLDFFEDDMGEYIEGFVGGFMGKASKNLVSKVERIYDYGYKETIHFSYEFDEDGYVTEWTEGYTTYYVTY